MLRSSRNQSRIVNMGNKMTKEQKENLTSFALLVMFSVTMILFVAKHTYNLYKYNKAEKQKQEIKAKQKNLSFEKTIRFNQR